MRGLILKDLYNLRKDGKMVLLISSLFIVIIFTLGNMDLFLSTIMLMFSATSITTFVCDNQSGWDTYVTSLPVPRRKVVMSKYVLVSSGAGGRFARPAGQMDQRHDQECRQLYGNIGFCIFALCGGCHFNQHIAAASLHVW